MSAAAAVAASPAAPEDQAFLLRAGGMNWAASAAAVQTIFRVGVITRVPLAPPVIAGLVNLRGRVVVAISLTERLLGAPCPREQRAPETFGIAIEHNGDTFALLVEDVGDVLALVDADRIALPSHTPPQLASVTTACFRTSRGIVPLLDIGSLVAIEADRRSGIDRRLPSSSQPGAFP